MAASSHCPICGHDQPHHHDSGEVRLERSERPAFEAALRTLLRDRRITAGAIQAGLWLETTPADGFEEHVPDVIQCSYAQAFGWGGLSRPQTIGGQDCFGPDHWLYRPHYGAPYANPRIELLWLIWLAAKEAADARP